MAVGTTTAPTANASALLRSLRKEMVRRSTRPLDPRGIFLIEASASVATANLDDVGDELRVIQFPDGNVYLLALKVESTDLDTNGAPTLQWDVITDDGTTERTLISNSAIGRAGGVDDLDADVDPDFLEVGGKYLGIKLDAVAATPAAGTIVMRALVYIEPTTSW